MPKRPHSLALVPASAPSPVPVEAQIVHQRVAALVPTLLQLLLSQPLPPATGMRDRLLQQAAANVVPSLGAKVATLPPGTTLRFVDCLMQILSTVKNTGCSEDEYRDTITDLLADFLADGEPQPA